MIFAASVGGIRIDDYSALIFVAIGFVVFIVFVLASRPISNFAGNFLAKRQARPDLVTISRRVVTIVVIALGMFAAVSFAVESANVALFALVLATIVAALGVQDLLRDYLSGYYLLFERHIRVGDHITFDLSSGVVHEVRLRVTLLRNDEGDVIVVPNSELFRNPVTIHGVTPEQEAKEAPPA